MNFYKLVMPEDMNNFGFLFGGKLLMWLDEFSWLAVTADYPGCCFVTRGMSDVSFKCPVVASSVLRFDANQVHAGRTSVTYHVDTYARLPQERTETHVFHTDITFVRMSKAGKPEPLPTEQKIDG